MEVGPEITRHVSGGELQAQAGVGNSRGARVFGREARLSLRSPDPRRTVSSQEAARRVLGTDRDDVIAGGIATAEQRRRQGARKKKPAASHRQLHGNSVSVESDPSGIRTFPAR